MTTSAPNVSSTVSHPSGAERRQHARRRVCWSTAWHDGRRARQGEVLDAGEGGVFLRPAWTPSEALRPGDALELRCRCAAGQDELVELVGEVCWIGPSADHGGEGIGLRIRADAGLARLLELAAAA